MNPNPAHLPNEIDNSIDRALSTLAAAQPRPGLNTRILTAVEQRATTPQPARLAFSAHLALWSATSAAIIGIAALVIVHHRSISADSSKNTVILSAAPSGAEPKDPETARSATTSEPFSTTNLAPTTAGPAKTPVQRTLSNARHPERSALARSRRTPVFSNCPAHPHAACPTPDTSTIAQAPTDPDAQALADLHAPSHPAPPPQLTAQEKLFLRVLRYGNATQLAELNPAIRDQRDADETTAFKVFFRPPPHIHQPGDPDETAASHE